MDGLDGLAGGMTVIGFICLAIIASNKGAVGYANGALLFSSVVLGFLLLNIPPAKIFMGDTGSATLGMLVTIYALLGIKLGILKVPEFLIIFSVFIADATLTLSRRVLQLQAFWKAHKTHYYQQLAEARPGRQGTLYIEYMLMIVSGIIVVIVNSLEIKHQIMFAITWYAALFSGFIILGNKLKTSNH
jgi:UDP-N-acetylmuramyl pentapeptide phosphotransferase/UDP-N-acetylglucosamine-1-phosphate transferase